LFVFSIALLLELSVRPASSKFKTVSRIVVTLSSPMKACVLVVFLSVAFGAYQRTPDHSIEYLLSLTSNPGGKPDDAPVAFDCAWRKLAPAYALQIQPSLTITQQKAMHDALQLTSLCDTPFKPVTPKPWANLLELNGANRQDIFVDGTNGSDTAAGAIDSPLKTVGAAVALSRKGNHSIANAPVIQLREGQHYLSDTIVLDKADSGLTIIAYKEEKVELSGGVLLPKLAWKQPNKSSPIYTTTVNKALVPQGIRALQLDGQRATLARYPNANPEQDMFPKGYVSATTTWLPPVYKGKECNPHHQCGTSVNYTIKTPPDEWYVIIMYSTQLLDLTRNHLQGMPTPVCLQR
jgi:hypothetical protein